MKKIIFFILLFLFSCSNDNKVKKLNRSFYYWKTSFRYLNNKEDSIVKEHKINKLYIKFFEIEHDELKGNIPFSKNKFNNFKVVNNIIPTIYIKNEVFLKSTKSDLDLLADNTNFLIQKYLTDVKVNEYQIDCDWTLNSKDNYFYFLKKIKEISKKKLSCTLRLYPFKYRTKMGIPPVDRVTLMCYNLINPIENPTKNSILDVSELEKYLTVEKKYPIPMDIALPIYSWMQLYQNNQFQAVFYDSHEYLLKNIKSKDSLWYEVTNDFSIGDHYIRVNDKIKYEKVTFQEILKAIKLIKKNVKFDKETTVSLFHLDNNQLQKYTNEEINHIYNSFLE